MTMMRYKAEIFDHMQYLYNTTGFNDHQLHCVIRFENKVNAEVMETSVRRLIKVIPILSRVYYNDKGNSYWEGNDTREWTDLFIVVKQEKEFERFTFSKIEEEVGPQIKVCLLQSKQDALSIVMNHMVTDGGGMKQCVYLLSELYSNIIRTPDYMPDYIIDGDRGFQKIIKDIPPRDKIKILLFHNKDNNKAGHYKFPMSSGQNIEPFILEQEILQDSYHKIHEYSKRNNVTMNDVILTAYFRVLSRMLHLKGETLNIPIMIDMRRYLKDKSFKALSNLSSTVIISIAVPPGENFKQTLEKVNAEMKAKKDNYLGLNPFLKLDTLYRIGKSKIGFQLLQKSLRNPEICMTNIGILDSKLLSFEGAVVSNAFLCGSIKHRPHFQMSASSFNDKMTFCVNLYGSPEDQENIKNFLSEIDRELRIETAQK